MNGQDILKALNDMDEEMLEAAEKCRKSKNKIISFRYVKYAAIAAVAVFGVILTNSAWQFWTMPVIVENQYIRLEDAYLLSERVERESTFDNLERENVQGTSPYVVKDGIVQIHLINGAYNDALLPQTGIGTNASTYLKKAIRELNGGENAEELKYLVEIEIYVPHPDYAELGWYADNEIYEAEYKRLTEENGYDLTWIAPGGYTIPDAYVYCLGCGIMYGALTEEEMNNFPINDAYSYGFRLISYDTYSFAGYPYKETYTSGEELRHRMIALKALRKLEEEGHNEENN